MMNNFSDLDTIMVITIKGIGIHDRKKLDLMIRFLLTIMINRVFLKLDMIYMR